MKKGVYVFAIGLVIYIQSGATTSDTVWLKDATDQRTLSNIDLPDELTFRLTRRSETLNLNLRRNHDINPNADVYFAEQFENGKVSLVQTHDMKQENLAYYQDIENGAFMTVRCLRKANKQCDRIINGNLRIGDMDYVLQPAETEVSSINSFDDPGSLGRKYLIQVEKHPAREYSFENKDVTQEMETNIGEKHIALTRRVQVQQQQKDLLAAVSSVLATNESTLHKSGKRDKSRQLPKSYYIKVAVVIDKGLWDFYYATVHSNPLTRGRNTIKLIHQLYSHIMNGINMLYKGIEDPRIRINVVLNKFIIWKTERDFQHVESKVLQYNGKAHIDGLPYLNDVINWDTTTAVTDEVSFSHGMVFTRYKLYDTDLAKSEPGGLCFTGEVCNIGKRMSIVESRAYVWTVRAAAHEMGHSLGADHDGELGSTACKSEDRYIMSSGIARNYPGEPYNKNPWLFSKCSINAFKRTLPTKTCVHNVGWYYDYNEYHKFVMKEPGTEFLADRQCELTVGKHSFLCETAPENICLLMRCTDPKTGECLPAYHGAARGTDCGSDMWCIDGLCVPKR